MSLFNTFIEIFLHLDTHLHTIIETYGTWTYLILFLIIFCETGLVVTPFLPGDSLLFAAGALAATGALNTFVLIILLIIAAVAGDTVNYWIGYRAGPQIFNRKVRFLKQDHLERTRTFYARYGGKTIILARFLPFIRTFAPFVAGIGSMDYKRFFSYNVLGGVIWISLFVVAGHFFGGLPAVKENFSLIIVAIIIISVLPAVYEFAMHRYQSQHAK